MPAMQAILSLFRPRAAAAPGVAFTVRSTVRAPGAELLQTLYLTEGWVMTELGGTLILFRRERPGRLVVDARARRLRPLDQSAQLGEMERLGSALGPARARKEPGLVRMEGFLCTRYTLRAGEGRVAAAAEVHAVSLPGLGDTALHAERLFDRRLDPLGVPLAPDELVVRSRTSVVSAGCERLQTSLLEGLEEGIQRRDELDEYVAFRVAG